MEEVVNDDEILERSEENAEDWWELNDEEEFTENEYDDVVQN